MHRLRGFRFLRFVLAMSLALSPLLSAASMQSVAGHPAHQMVSGAEHVQHVAHQHAGGSDAMQACANHDGCGGQCCVTCTHCVTDIFRVTFQSLPHHPVQAPTVLTLRLASRPSVQDRPPQF